MKNTALILVGLLWSCLGLAVRASQAAVDVYDTFTIVVTAILSVVLLLYALDLE